MLEVIVSTIIGVFVGGIITWHVSRHYSKIAAGELRLITRVVLMGLARGQPVHIEQDKSGRFVHVAIGNRGAMMLLNRRWWERVFRR